MLVGYILVWWIGGRKLAKAAAADMAADKDGDGVVSAEEKSVAQVHEELDAFSATQSWEVLSRKGADLLVRMVPLAGTWWFVVAIRANYNMGSTESGAECEPVTKGYTPMAGTDARFVICMCISGVALGLLLFTEFIVHLHAKANPDPENEVLDKDGDGVVSASEYWHSARAARIR